MVASPADIRAANATNVERLYSNDKVSSMRAIRWPIDQAIAAGSGSACTIASRDTARVRTT